MKLTRPEQLSALVSELQPLWEGGSGVAGLGMAPDGQCLGIAVRHHQPDSKQQQQQSAVTLYLITAAAVQEAGDEEEEEEGGGWFVTWLWTWLSAR